MLKNIDLAAIGVTAYNIYVNKAAMETGVDPDVIKLYAKDTEVQRLLNLIDTREGYGLNSLYKETVGNGAFLLGRAVPGAALGVGYTNRFPSLNIFGQLLNGRQSSSSGLTLPGAELFTQSGVPVGLSPGEALDTPGQEFIDIGGQNDSIGTNGQAGSETGYISEGDVGQYTQTIKWGIQNIDVRPAGKGFFGERMPQSNPRVDAYELKINPNNESYYLSHPDGGYVQYENMINDVVVDGKLIIQQRSFYHVYDLPEFARNKVLQEAIRQVEAASNVGYSVEWLISDSIAVHQLSDFFRSKHINIYVKYLPE